MGRSAITISASPRALDSVSVARPKLNLKPPTSGLKRKAIVKRNLLARATLTRLSSPTGKIVEYFIVLPLTEENLLKNPSQSQSRCKASAKSRAHRSSRAKKTLQPAPKILRLLA